MLGSKNVFAFSASCFFFSFNGVQGSSENYGESATIKSFTVSEGNNAFYKRMPCRRQNHLSNMWETCARSLSPCTLSLSVLLIEIIAVTHFTRRRAGEAGHWLDFHGKADSAIQGLIGPVLTALCARGGEHAAFIVPMVCWGKTRERSGDKDLNGNSSPCVPLPLTAAAGRLVSSILASSATPTLSQTARNPPSPALFFILSSGCRGVAVLFSDPWHPPLRVPSPLRAEVVCHLHLQESALRLYLLWTTGSQVRLVLCGDVCIYSNTNTLAVSLLPSDTASDTLGAVILFFMTREKHYFFKESLLVHCYFAILLYKLRCRIERLNKDYY